ncbi:unnamed protein product [Didymodactylos carnosus]|uniref:Pseudouridylate synthase 1 homolog n=1 Tax=Didymodactylos carnosus TaxID=1234261 RepID=A0A813NTQ5_9BILA|nr:unnamed protein product [Didymodactylos carnosus]CAF3516752.1 unnamed protein product [Didymodactylos carnosus]
MLSPSRCASQTIMKAVASSTLNHQSAASATIVEEMSGEKSITTTTDDDGNTEPLKKKFKEDTSVEIPVSPVATSSSETPKRTERLKKRKVAVLFGYCGAGYFGLQRNTKDREHRTIEDEVVDAFVKVGAIPQEHADDMSKMAFQRAARTDKGVSAVANLLSLKLSPIENLTEKVNEHLPKQIRLYGFKRVAASFNSKNNCDARTYIYILPTFAFCPIEEITRESYRATPEIVQIVRDVIREYVGTHNFHNFTSGKKFTDPSSKRYIHSVTLTDPYMRDNIEFTTITIKGQSFMIHQIRKMVSLVIAIVRGVASRDTIQLAYGADKIDIPKAPPLGLVLDRLHYDRYDKKFGNDGHHELLTWKESEETFTKFKEEYIIPYIVKKEITDKSMLVYLERLIVHSFSILTDGDWRLTYPYQIIFQKVRRKMGADSPSQLDDEDEDDDDANEG